MSYPKLATSILILGLAGQAYAADQPYFRFGSSPAATDMPGKGPDSAGGAVTLSQSSGSIQEGGSLSFKATADVSGVTWAMSGAPAGSSIDPATGVAVLYGGNVEPVNGTALVRSTITVTGTGASAAVRPATFTLDTIPAMASLVPGLVRVHPGGTVTLQAQTDMAVPGTWSPAGGDAQLGFAEAGAKTTSATFTAPANGGGVIVPLQVSAAYTAPAPNGGVPASATASATVQVYPTLAIAGMNQDDYAIDEGAVFNLAPSPAAGSVIGQPQWAFTGLPPGITMPDPSTGALAGTATPGTASATPYQVVASLRDSQDASQAGVATRSVRMSVTPRTLLKASPDSLFLGQTLGSPSQCSTLTLTNNGSLPATKLAIKFTSTEFAACTPATGTACTGSTSLSLGASCVFGAALNGSQPGTPAASAVISSNAQDVTVPVQGTVVAADMAWDPAAIGPGITLSGSNLQATSASNNSTSATVARAIRPIPAGRYYFESRISVYSGNPGVGILTASAPLNTYIGAGNDGIGFYRDARSYPSATATGIGQAVQGTVYMVAVDTNLRRIWFGMDGKWAGDPGAGTGGFTIPFSGAAYPGVSLNPGSAEVGVFKQTAYPPPSRFVLLP